MLEFVEGVFAAEGSKGAFEVVDEGPRGVGVGVVRSEAGAEGYVVVDGGGWLAGVGEVGFLRALVREGVSGCCRQTWVFQ